MDTKIYYKVEYEKSLSTFEDYDLALSYFKEKKDANKKNVKLTEVKTEITETILQS